MCDPSDWDDDFSWAMKQPQPQATADHTPEWLSVDDLAERLYEWSGGIFWRGETSWQDRHREEARQWFAYADLLDRLAALTAERDGLRERVEAVKALRDDLRAEWLRAPLTGRGQMRGALLARLDRALLDPSPAPEENHDHE